MIFLAQPRVLGPLIPTGLRSSSCVVLDMISAKPSSYTTDAHAWYSCPHVTVTQACIYSHFNVHVLYTCRTPERSTHSSLFRFTGYLSGARVDQDDSLQLFHSKTIRDDKKQNQTVKKEDVERRRGSQDWTQSLTFPLKTQP